MKASSQKHKTASYTTRKNNVVSGGNEHAPPKGQSVVYQQMADSSAQVSQLAAYQEMADNHVALQPAPVNNTGLPDNLKTGIENLSGYAMDDVNVHYNSSKPAQLQAYAYTQGTDIHVAPGQEKHLPHEAWHVVQQKQGRVQPTLQMKSGVQVNDDTGLEQEADVMGEKSLSVAGISQNRRHGKHNALKNAKPHANHNTVQRMMFKNKDRSAQVDVTKDEIVEQLNKWMIRVLMDDDLTTKPLDINLEQGYLNWDEVYKVGLPRKTKNIFHLYSVLKEAKTSPGYAFALSHGITNHENQLASNTLTNNDRSKKNAIDGMLYASGNLGDEVKGEGVAYKELSMSFSSLSEKNNRGNREVAQAHLKLLNGEKPAGYTDDEIGKMYYHLEVMHLAEGRRSAGMFAFAPITMQNIADGKITGIEAFGKVEKVKKNGKMENKVTEPGNFPAAWVGSKAPLEEIERHFKSGGNIMGNEMRRAYPKKVLDKMRLQVEKFFEDRRDFSSDELKNIPGADFTDKKGALEAIINLVKEKYFFDIPAMYEKSVNDDNPKRKKRRKKQEKKKGDIKMLDIAHKEMKKTNETFSDSDSENELSAEIISVISSRNKYKNESNPGEKKNLKRKRAAKRKLDQIIDSKDVYFSEDSEVNDYIEFTQKNWNTFENAKRMKEDYYGKGVKAAQEGKSPDQINNELSDPKVTEDEKKLFAEGYKNEKNKLYEEAYMAGIKNDISKNLQSHPLGKDAFEKGGKVRAVVIQTAREHKNDDNKQDLLNFEPILGEFAKNNFDIQMYLSMLYSTTYDGKPENSSRPFSFTF